MQKHPPQKLKLHNLFNITIERTLHKIIITHITFYNYKKILFKQFKHMMHIEYTQLLCRHLFNYCADTQGVTIIIRNQIVDEWPTARAGHRVYMM